MHTVLVVVQVLVAVSLIGLVLVQHGKGADAGAAFGSGSSGTVFGARGAANFLSRATSWLAAAFFASSLALAYLVSTGNSTNGSVLDSVPGAAVVPDPVADPAGATAPAIPVVVTDAPAAVEAAPAASAVDDAPKAPEQ